MKFAHFLRFYEELVKLLLVKKYWLLDRFVLYVQIYFRFCLIIWYDIYCDYLVENESVIFLSQNGKYERL